MNNILVVFTGGTIGATVQNGVIDVETNSNEYKLISLYKEQYSCENIKFKTIEPLNILSENLNPRAWTSIIESIEKEDLKQYDGIILTHGTDTLAYTSSLLSIYFNSLELPLILVSSDFTLDKKTANGLINFDAAIKLIQTKNEKGIFVSYANINENPKIHFGSKLMTSLPLDCYFMSIKNKPYLEYKNNEFITIDNTKPDIEINKHLQPIFSDKVLLIKPFPGLNYDIYNLDNIDVIVHDLYHSGTACTSSEWGDKYSLIPFLDKCKKKDIKVYLAAIESSDESYQSTKELIDAGAEIIFDKTIEMVYGNVLINFKHKNLMSQVKSMSKNKNINLYHATQLKEFELYCKEQKLLSREAIAKKLDNFTKFFTDEKDKELNIWNKVFGNLNDFGKNFNQYQYSIPNAYGPICLVFLENIWDTIENPVFTERSITTKNYKCISNANGFLDKNQFIKNSIEVSFDNEIIISDSTIKEIIIDPLFIDKSYLIDKVTKLTDELGIQRTKVKIRNLDKLKLKNLENLTKWSNKLEGKLITKNENLLKSVPEELKEFYNKLNNTGKHILASWLTYLYSGTLNILNNNLEFNEIDYSEDNEQVNKIKHEIKSLEYSKYWIENDLASIEALIYQEIGMDKCYRMDISKLENELYEVNSKIELLIEEMDGISRY
ncbi:MAG: hypothetical protein DRG78_14365 [Epsilonproteobacteria bacterium]|nr:MAG: hypothetical protein DRG78_14365 [Campylobacterota bacterium]